MLACSGQQAELTRFAGGVCPRAAAQLGEDVAHVHVHGARAQEEIHRDFPIRPADGYESDDLELASGKPAVLELTGCVSAVALIDAFPELCEFRLSAARERPRAELARCPVRVGQPLDCRLALAGRSESDARAKLRLRTIVRMTLAGRPPIL